MRTLGTCLSFFLLTVFLWAGGEWFKSYEEGQQAMERSEWQKAATLFREALQGNDKDSKKARTYGMHFIEYYPHRELGICFYNLNEPDKAKRELEISMRQQPSERARDYLNKIERAEPPSQGDRRVRTPARETPPVAKPPVGAQKPAGAAVSGAATAAGATVSKDTGSDMIVGKKTVKEVGERMGVAILPFENKGASRDLGEIILDKMITVLVNQQRFKVMERSQLDKILEEQQLGASGVLDAQTAAQIGKGIGVDGIIIGSVAATTSGALSIDARVIDTESAAIIVANDAYSGSSDAQSVKNAVENLANKIIKDLPLVEGYVIRITDDNIILDIGRVGGLKRGLKCIIYKEGAAITHPITGEVLGKDTIIIGEVLITEVYDKYSEARKLAGEGVISIGDKFLTK
jgi:TolB-like protein